MSRATPANQQDNCAGQDETSRRPDISDPMYKELSERTKLPKSTLARHTNIDNWDDQVDLETNPTLEQLSTYMACAIGDLHTTTLDGEDWINFYKEIFEGWTVEHFEPIVQTIKSGLMEAIRERKLKVAKTDRREGKQAEQLAAFARGQYEEATPGPSTPQSSSLPVRGRSVGQPPIPPPQFQTPAIQVGGEELPPSPPSHNLPQTAYTLYATSQAHPPLPHARGYPQPPVIQPYMLPPRVDTVPERPPPEKLIQFQKAWRKKNNYTGKPYDILADKARMFVEVCRRLDIPESQYADLFPEILQDRANAFYLYNLGPGHTWKTMYKGMDRHFNTNVNHSQYYTDWTTMTYARTRQENPDKSPHKTLEAMFDKLTLAQRVLGAAYHGPEQLRTTSRAKNSLATYDPHYRSIWIARQRIILHPLAHTTPTADTPTTTPVQSTHKEDKDSRGTVQAFTVDRQTRGIQGRRSALYVTKRDVGQAITHITDTTPSHKEIDAFITEFEGVSEDNTDTEEEEEQDGNDTELAEAVQYLTNAAFLHRTTQEMPHAPYNDGEPIQADQFVLDNHYGATYQGELWDTGAAKVSTVGKEQLKAYLEENPCTEVQWDNTETTISFGGQNPVQSLGSARIHNPLGTVTYHILDTPTPFLLSLADADRLGAYYNNVLDIIVRKDSTTIPVVRKWGHPFFNVGKHEQATLFFTKAELRRLHRRFGHPCTERLHRLLTNAGHEADISILEEIKKFCHFCQTYGPAPSRFKFSIKDDTHFNYEIIIDTI
ncbi:hypothetical protein EJ04DRAFT_571234 [Polyplosphaeria fusca]|uniref:Uncharacterized protein n=1 Tax=Polyplosphaeria fusca TaxID=682080 RepID=A0A9P4QKE1_9PLEO|nr:hypothetical protein EJ04DRAFT_571234 [Polyplosphaeria fusca]